MHPQTNFRHRLMNTLSIAAFVALMAILLWPAVQNRPRSGRRSQCKNNLKPIGLALHNFHDVHSSFPPRQQGDPPQSWRVAILPYLDQADLYNRYQRDKAWDSSENAVFAKEKLAVYQCPQQRHHTDALGRWLTSYAAVTGPHCIWQDDRTLAVPEIKDGTSTTILVVEACGHKIVWNEPRDMDITQTPLTFTLAGHRSEKSPGVCSSYHLGGAHVLLADGSVRFLAQKIDAETLRALLTADGGDTVGEF